MSAPIKKLLFSCTFCLLWAKWFTNYDCIHYIYQSINGDQDTLSQREEIQSKKSYLSKLEELTQTQVIQGKCMNIKIT